MRWAPLGYLLHHIAQVLILLNYGILFQVFSRYTPQRLSSSNRVEERPFMKYYGKHELFLINATNIPKYRKARSDKCTK